MQQKIDEDDEEELDMDFDNLSVHSGQGVKKEKSENQPEARLTQRFSRHTTMRTTEVFSRNSFIFEKKLGEGAYGLVHLVKKKDTGKYFALKELQK
jgi:serine/threonine protein kinase